MIDWIKYFPIQLRQLELFKKQQSPRGPSFSLALTKKFRIGGSELSFKAPRHLPSHSSYKSYSASRNIDLLLNRFNAYSRGTMPDDSWLSKSAFSRNFGFFGPWFIGSQYQLSMYINIITPRTPSEEVSFFHPRVFENSLANYLTSLYAQDGVHTARSLVAPVNWVPIKTLPIPAVIYDIMPSPENNTAKREQMLCFPVSDKHIVKVTLRHETYNHSMALNNKELEKYFDFTPMKTLANDIINSFQLRLSPEAQAQYDKVKSTCPDMSLVKEFAPLKWSTDESSSPNDDLPSLESGTA